MAGLSALGEKYPAGRYEVWGMGQYTNRRLGMVQARPRFGCRPETTTLILRGGTG
jgi:predicted MPP superfamily phosphohydrolase